MRRLSLLGVLALAACADEPATDAGLPTERQELVIATLADARDRPFVTFGYSAGRGWHLARPADPALDTRPPLTSALDAGEIFEDFESDQRGPTLRFSGSTGGASGFVGSSGAASGFSGGTPSAGSFSGEIAGSGGFSGSLSSGTGLTCDLRGLCDFAMVLCDAFSQLDEEGGGAAGCDVSQLGTCYAQINSVQVPAEIAPLVCVFAEFFGCVGRVVLAQGLSADESSYAACASALDGFAQASDFFEDEVEDESPSEL